MTYEDLITYCKPADISGPPPEEIGMITQDSRKVTEGSVFIAVEGLKRDGHAFIGDAIARGASVIITEKPFYTEKKVCILEVADSRSLVGPLAQAFYGNPADKMKLIGITGTNGKTTVATLVYQALQKLGTTPSLLGTVAKRIGTKTLDSRLTTADPVELASDMQQMVRAGSTHLVMEVSSHALDQQRIDGLDFLVAAFTNLSHDHLDYHNTLDDYARSKKKLFDGLNPDAWAVINADDEKSEYMVLDCDAQIINFSFHSALSADCKIISSTADGLQISVDGYTVNSSLVGRFNAYNIAESFLICRALGYEGRHTAEALSGSPGAAGRLERVQSTKREKQPLVLVDYAHTPDALENVLETLADLKTEKQKLHVIFGCGGDRDKTKRPVMAAISEQYADLVTVTSDNPRSENADTIIDQIMEGFSNADAVIRRTDRRTAIRHAIQNSDENTIILIAGKGHETYQEIGDKRIDFDDRKIALKALDNPGQNVEVS